MWLLTEEIERAKTDEEAEICIDVMLAEAGVEIVEVIKVVVTTGKEAVAKVVATEEEAVGTAGIAAHIEKNKEEEQRTRETDSNGMESLSV